MRCAAVRNPVSLLFCFILACASGRLYAETAPVDATADKVALAESVQTSSLSDFEERVRRVAEQTAAEEKARQKEARLAAEAERKSKPAEPFTFFKYRKNGATAYSDRAPRKTDYQVIVYNSCYACSPLSTVDWRATKLYLTEFNYSIGHAAKIYGVDPALVRAIIHAESNFNPLARSRKGAMGLMQLMPQTAKDMGVDDITDPTENIAGGVKYLAWLLERFNGDVKLATAAYNAGPGAVSKYNGVPPYEETQTYVFRVNILHKRYKTLAALAKN